MSHRLALDMESAQPTRATLFTQHHPTSEQGAACASVQKCLPYHKRHRDHLHTDVPWACHRHRQLSPGLSPANTASSKAAHRLLRTAEQVGKETQSTLRTLLWSPEAITRLPLFLIYRDPWRLVLQTQDSHSPSFLLFHIPPHVPGHLGQSVGKRQRLDHTTTPQGHRENKAAIPSPEQSLWVLSQANRLYGNKLQALTPATTLRTRGQ
jgi:hypothetical protein